jgi:hypothetical protein
MKFTIGGSVLLLLSFLDWAASSRGVNRSIKIVNKTGVKIVIYWVNPQSRETVLMSDENGLPSKWDAMDGWCVRARAWLFFCIGKTIPL